MRIGPTSLKVNTVLARGLHRPRLRTDLQISEQVVAGEVSFVLKVPELLTYARYGPVEYSLLKLADGTRTPQEIAAAMNEEYGADSFSAGDVGDFIESTNPNMWERGAAQKNLALLEKIREERRERVNTASLLYIHFSAWNPDRTLDRMMPYLRWLFTPAFVAFSVFLYVVMGIILAQNWPRVRQDTIEFYTFSHKTFYDIWFFWAMLFIVIAIHEFGHGLTCKYFGGEVPKMGFMLIYFGPAFFTDTTDMHVFDKTSKRLWVIFAGLWIEMVICALATIAWVLCPPGSFLGDFFYKILLLTGISGLVFNLNPLMKYDGYYALAQYLEVDNMREDSFEYVQLWARRYLLRQEVSLPPVGRRKRRIYLAYGISAFLYSVFIIVLVTRWLRNSMVGWLGSSWGYIVTAWLLYLMLRKRLRPLVAAARTGWPQAKENLMAWKITRGQQVGLVAAVILLAIPPLARKTSSEFVLEPGARAEVRALADGWVEQVRVQTGQRVAAGEALALLRNPGLEARTAQLEGERALAERALLAARGRGDLGATERSFREYQRLDVELGEARQRISWLVLTAPISGVVVTQNIEQRTGEHLADGASFAEIADRSTMRARILVRDWELQDVAEGALVKLNVRASPYRTYSGTVRQILPAAALDEPVTEPKTPEHGGQPLSNYFAAVLEFPNPDDSLREGMTGTAKIAGRRRPLAWHWARGTWRWLRSQVW
jgi:putative peptide zinc metalloprotease protein